MPQFLFATGIEGSAPVISDGHGGQIRYDQMEASDHYHRWREDFALVEGLGLRHLRWGPPIHRTWLGPEHYDWSFSDDALAELARLRIEPIVDLCHFGMPDWLGNSFQNHEFAPAFARYAADFARRYPWVRLFTPVNEIYICARFSAELGWWNERLLSRGIVIPVNPEERPAGGVWNAGPGAEVPFVTALKNMCRAGILAMEEILRVSPESLFVQSESTEYYHPVSPEVEARAEFLNLRRFLSLDLTYGRHVSAPIYEYLTDNGLDRGEYDWFMEHGVKLRNRCILGTDYYKTNEQLVHPDGRIFPIGEVLGYYVVMTDYERRYHLPVMYTETNLADPDQAKGWLWQQMSSVRRLRLDLVPVVGFTWYGLTDMVDWDIGLREKRGVITPVGLFDLDRRERPVATAYRQLVKDFGHYQAWDSALAHLELLADPDRLAGVKSVQASG
ncbi:MAG: glycosyl hydrolase family protein [Planctomycetota bacterium]|nr:glycosyl hydrolase family protein [Planctomycetota bacterium]